MLANGWQQCIAGCGGRQGTDRALTGRGQGVAWDRLGREVTCGDLNSLPEALAVQLPQHEQLAALHIWDHLQLGLPLGHGQAPAIHGDCADNRVLSTVWL